MFKKIIAEGAEARKKILKGALQVGRMVGMSLGPYGRNAIIQEKYMPPMIVNDGKTIAQHTFLDDELEDLGAQVLIDACMKTDERTGDATTTTAVLAVKTIKDYSEKIQEEDEARKNAGIPGGANVNEMAKEILDTRAVVIEKLKEQAHELKKGELKHIVATSLGKVLPDYVEKIAEIVESVDRGGFIEVTDNWNTKYGVEHEVIKGMRFDGYFASEMLANTKYKEAIYEDIPVLVTNYEIDSLAMLGQLIQQLGQKGTFKIAIVADKFSKQFITQILRSTIAARQGKVFKVGNGIQRPFEFLAIRAPSLTTEKYEDVAVFCDAKLVDKNLEHKLTDIKVEDLGLVQRAIVTDTETAFTGGRGKVGDRVKLLEAQVEKEKDPSFKAQTKRRLGALQSGFAVIRVGAATEPEREFVKRKIEDAVHSAQAAQEEGVIQGGGLALKKIAEELGEKHPLYGTLIEPYNKIQESAGGKLIIGKNVIDPLKAVRIAVENAFSVAAAIITAEVGIADRRKSLWDELDAKILPRVEVDDFRDDENQEKGYK